MNKIGSKIAIFCCLVCFFLVGRSITALADPGWQIKQNISPNLRPESPQTCALYPPLTRQERVTADLRQEDFSPDRFRRGLGNNFGTFDSNNFGQDASAPIERIAVASPTNYGDRFFFDVNGQPAYHAPIIVLHETVATVNQTLNFFQTPQRDEANQASYHVLIGLDGEIIYIVPPDKRAFGAGNSLFVSQGINQEVNQGFNQSINQETGEVTSQWNNQPVEESVKTNPDYPPSVNNFAYHISLETPRDGLNNARTHSGYTDDQYRSLAWLVAKTGVPEYRITTHQGVDRSGERIDPRSFDNAYFLAWYQVFPKTQEIFIGCLDPQTPNP